MLDSIEREVFISAPVEHVWELVTRSEHVGRWFGDDGADIDLRPGGRMTLSWKKHGTVLGRVEAVEPPNRFVCVWACETDIEPVPGKSTQVEFTLAAEDDGTRVRVVESGFASLDYPDAERVAKRAGNVEGWQAELGDLVAYATDPSPVAR